LTANYKLAANSAAALLASPIPAPVEEKLAEVANLLNSFCKAAIYFLAYAVLALNSNPT